MKDKDRKDKTSSLDDLRERIKGYINECDNMSDQYDRMAEDLEFRCGEQWTQEERSARGARPAYVLNITDSYISRVVAPLLKHPIGMKVSTSNEELDSVLMDRLRDVEYSSMAENAYAQAYDNAVTCGRGFFILTKDYRGNGFTQDLKVEIVNDPTSVFIDPASVNIDGSDARWGIWRTFVKCDEDDEDEGEPIAVDMFSNFTIPEDTKVDMVVYEMKSREKKIFQLEDGTVVDEVPEGLMAINTREVKDDYCCVHHFIGNNWIEEDYTELEISHIPIIPVYGKVSYKQNDKLGFYGLVKSLRDINKGENYLYSNEMEMVALAPKPKWVMAGGQAEGYERKWSEANTSTDAYLEFNQTDNEGRPAPAPQYVQFAPNIGPLMAMRDQLNSMAARVTGIFDPMFGGFQSGEESGRARFISVREGELSTLPFYSHLVASIRHATRVAVEYLIRDFGPQEYRFKKPEGQSYTKMVDFAQFGDIYNFDFDYQAGPLFANAKEEGLSAIAQITAINPEAGKVLQDLAVGLSDFEGAQEAKRRLELLLPPELRKPTNGQAPDPEALAALQQQEQAMAEMEAQMQAMIDSYEAKIKECTYIIVDQQLKLTNKENEIKAKLEQEAMKQQAETERNTQDNMTEIAIKEMEHGNKIEVESIKEVGQTERKVLDLSKSPETPEDSIPRIRANIPTGRDVFE